MRRQLRYLTGLIAALGLTRCDLYLGPKRGGDDWQTYCDGSACYTCDDYGCYNTGRPRALPGETCAQNADCAEGCFCLVDSGASSGSCSEAGFCNDNSDCASGMTCEVARRSCVPPDTMPTGCQSDAACRAGQYCDERTGACVPSDVCTGSGADMGCGPGFVCDSRASCVPAPCDSDGQCMAGCYCDEASRECVETATCTSDADCTGPNSGMVCTSRQSCEPAMDPPDPPPACTSDAMCGTGMACCDGTCHSPYMAPVVCQFDSQCGAGRTCVNGGCVAKCSTSADCGTGQACDATTGRCVTQSAGQCVYNTDCGADKACVNGTCFSNCSQDTDCADAQDMCDRGLCKPDYRARPECRVNADCAGGQECVNAVCRKACAAAADCQNCEDGPVCDRGYCYTANEVSPMCSAASQCTSGQSCVNASCAP